MVTWNRFTDRLRAIMFRANHEAIKLKASTITPAHLFAAIVHEGSGVGMTLVRFCGIYKSDVKNPYDSPAQPKTGALRPEHKLPLDQTLHQMIEVAIEEAVGLGDDYVGTEHMVLALAGRPDGPLQEEMAKAGLGVAALRTNLLMLRLWSAGENARASRKWKDAVACYRKALAYKPAEPILLNNLAWILATCPDETIRSRQEALQLIVIVESDLAGATWWMLGTLAAAYAEAGDFAKAIIWGNHAMQKADGADEGRWAKWIAGFAEGRPIRDG
jgi:tetratricopeptide (TPR) repeat protein